MMLRLLAAASLLGLLNTAGAVRVLEQVERPFELTLSQLTLPTSTTGTLSFKECADCRTMSPRVTPATTYVLNDRPVTLEELQASVAQISRTRGGPQSTTVGVFLDITTGRVTRIRLNYANL
jgi:hypothetical protein